MMSKPIPIVHVILPKLVEGSPEANVATRALDSFVRQMYPFKVVIGEGDSAHISSKNPIWMKEADVYTGGQTPSNDTSCGIQRGYEQARSHR